MFGLVDGLVGLDEDSRARALHGDGGEVVENVTSLCKMAVPPHFQMSLTSQPGGNLQAETLVRAEPSRIGAGSQTKAESWTVRWHEI